MTRPARCLRHSIGCHRQGISGYRHVYGHEAICAPSRQSSLKPVGIRRGGSHHLQRDDPRQAVLVADLQSIAEKTEKSGLKPPALFVVGNVVRMRDGLDWLGFAADGKRLTSTPLAAKE